MGSRNIMDGMMTCTDYADTAREYARRLEDREAARSGLTIQAARGVVARHLRIAPGTLENLRNGRLKSVAAHLFARLRERVEHEIIAEIQALEHELQLARTSGVDPRSNEIAAAEAALSQARKLMGK